MSTTDYSSENPDNSSPLELPEAATPSPRPIEPPSVTVEGLTVAEAATAYGLSVSTVRRLLNKNRISGAAKITGVKGVEYRIPPEALEALGYSRKETLSGAVLTAAQANLEAEQYAAKVRELEALLELERARREVTEVRAQLLQQNLDDLRDLIAKLPPMLEAPKRRGIFRRK
jgi:excisionase family DNA binding protein